MMEETAYPGREPVDWEGNYRRLKDIVETAIRQAGKQPDHREAKDLLIKAQSAFKEFKLRGEEREELYRALQDAFQQRNRQIADERARFEQEAHYHYLELKMKVDEAIRLAEKEHDWREAKKYLIEAQSAFRGLRLLKEQREELFGRLQKAFESVNLRQESESLQFHQESIDTYNRLKPLVENAFAAAKQSNDLNASRENLIRVQAEFKGIRLEKEKREQLYGRLQEAFDLLNQRNAAQREQTIALAGQNYEYYLGEVGSIVQEAPLTQDFKEVRERIRALQVALKDSVLLREQKDSLYAGLQEAFVLLNKRQDEERTHFEQASQANYGRLSKLVADGLLQAQESTEFRQTREFLKKIQGEFKGIRMQREHREELYARLQSAFTILRERTDAYFREKQKHWEVRMEFRLKDLGVHVLELQVEVSKEKERIEELEDQLDILEQRAGDPPAKLMVKAQIQSLMDSIHKKEAEIDATRQEIEQLESNIGQETPPEEDGPAA